MAATRKTREQQRASVSEEIVYEIITRFETAGWGFSDAGSTHDAIYARHAAISATDELRAALRACLRLPSFREKLLTGPNLEHPEHDDEPCEMQTQRVRYAVSSCTIEIKECSLLPAAAREKLCSCLAELTDNYAGALTHAVYAALARTAAVIGYLKSKKVG